MTQPCLPFFEQFAGYLCTKRFARGCTSDIYNLFTTAFATVSLDASPQASLPKLILANAKLETNKQQSSSSGRVLGRSSVVSREELIVAEPDRVRAIPKPA